MTTTVILLHGILRTHRSMGSLAKYLDRNGYRVFNIGYPSTRYPLETLRDVIHPRVVAATALSDSVNFVGYSMGGLLIRAYIQAYRPVKLRRVVMLGTPNNGSEVADFLKVRRLYRWLYGAAGQQLITEQSAFKHCFGRIDYELGIIAGSRSFDPLSSYLIGKPNDGKVSIESTKIEGMQDHLVLPVAHTFFPQYRSVWDQTLHFLNEGKFKRD